MCVCPRPRPSTRLCWRTCHRPPVTLIVTMRCAASYYAIGREPSVRPALYIWSRWAFSEILPWKRICMVERVFERRQTRNCVIMKLIWHLSSLSILIVHCQYDLTHDQEHSSPYKSTVAWRMLCTTTCLWHTCTQLKSLFRSWCSNTHAHRMSLERRKMPTLAAGETATQCAAYCNDFFKCMPCLEQHKGIKALC